MAWAALRRPRFGSVGIGRGKVWGKPRSKAVAFGRLRPNGGVWVCYGAFVRVRRAESLQVVSKQLDALVGLGVPRMRVQCLLDEFGSRSGVVGIYVIVVELGERGVHVGVGQQVMQVGVVAGEGGGFVEVVYGALVIGDFAPADASSGVTPGVAGLKREHLGEVVDGADVVGNAVLVVGVALQDFIPFVGLGVLVVGVDSAFVAVHAGHGFGHRDVRVWLVWDQIYGPLGGGSCSPVVLVGDVPSWWVGSVGTVGLSLGRRNAKSRHRWRLGDRWCWVRYGVDGVGDGLSVNLHPPRAERCAALGTESVASR